MGKIYSLEGLLYRKLYIDHAKAKMIQDKIKVLTKGQLEQIRKELLNGRKLTEICYPEFVQKQKRLPSKLPIFEIVNGYGILAYEYVDGTTKFGSINMKTGVPGIYGRTSLNEIRKDIKKDLMKKIEEEHPGIYSIKKYYDSSVRLYLQEQRYGGRVNRFPLQGERFVLDLGAGDNPDLRPTHAIDLTTPENQFTGLAYETGYDLQSLTRALPYQDNFFHCVVSYGGLAINFESKKIYKEIYRVLKSGGTLEFNHATENTQKWLKKAGFQNIRNDEFFDEIVNEKIEVIIAIKPKQRQL